MKISREAQRMARQLFEAAFVEGPLGKPQLDQKKSLIIADAILETRPRHAFQILKEFRRLSRLELSQHHAFIESATPLESASQEVIVKALQARDPQVEISITTNPSLIGGTRIRLGSDVWDGSVLARLKELVPTSAL